MDRKQFLQIVWNKGIKPLLLVIVIYYCVSFLVNIFAQDGPERMLTVGFLSLCLLFAVTWLVAIIFNKPASMKRGLSLFGKIINYAVPFLLGAMLYHFWQKDWKTVSVVIAILLVQQVVRLVKEEKSEVNS
jgi:predicted PurR-regulated permease PerM